MDNFFKQSILFDIYGNLLKGNQKLVYEYHILDDLSFNEIGEELGLTRQAAHDLFKRADEKLKDYDNKLNLSKILNNIETIANKIINISNNDEEVKLLNEIISLTKKGGSYGSKNSPKKTGSHS